MSCFRYFHAAKFEMWQRCLCVKVRNPASCLLVLMLESVSFRLMLEVRKEISVQNKESSFLRAAVLICLVDSFLAECVIQPHLFSLVSKIVMKV